MQVANLFAYRTHDPDVLARAHDPVGPDNDRTLRRVARRNRPLVAAWGSRGGMMERDREFLEMLPRGREVLCLGLTLGGLPRHPLYLRVDTAPVPFGLSAHSDGV